MGRSPFSVSGRTIRPLVVLAAAVVALLVAFFVLSDREDEAPLPSGTEETAAMFQIAREKITSVQITNSHGTYEARPDGGRIRVGDIPMDALNDEYAEMLFDEVSNLTYLTIADENAADMGLYGLDDPEALVTVFCLGASGTAETFTFEIGGEETVLGGRYARAQGSGCVYLLPQGRTVRFTMPIEKYIDFIIIPPNYEPDVMAVIRDISFGGTKLPEPIVIEAIREGDEAQLRAASSFGVATHLVVSPAYHEINPKTGLAYFDSLLGLISEGIVAYNLEEDSLRALGFDAPWLHVVFDCKNGKSAPVTHYDLKIVKTEEGLILTRGDEGIVYRILDVAFTKVTYEDAVSRLFLSPFLMDVRTVILESGDASYTFELAGDTGRDLKITCRSGVFSGERELDATAFRKFYTLLVSAASDGSRLIDPVNGGEVMTLQYDYRDPEKPDDVIRFFSGDVRRINAEVNGVTEFAMRETYCERVLDAADKLLWGEDFPAEW